MNLFRFTGKLLVNLIFSRQILPVRQVHYKNFKLVRKICEIRIVPVIPFFYENFGDSVFNFREVGKGIEINIFTIILPNPQYRAKIILLTSDLEALRSK